MKYRLGLSYRWMIVSADGLLKVPKDRWGSSHPLSRSFESREQAIEEYARFINEEIECPASMILVEEHSRDINWDE